MHALKFRCSSLLQMLHNQSTLTWSYESNGVKKHTRYYPTGDNIPMVQHFAYWHFRINRMIAAKEVEFNKIMLAFSIHAETPLHASPTYNKSMLTRTA